MQDTREYQRFGTSDGGRVMSGFTPAFLYVLGVPLAAGLATVQGLEIGGFNYTGFMWLYFLVAGIIILLANMAVVRENQNFFPAGPWLLWFGYLGLSLSWCAPLEFRNVQDALQITMPLLIGVVASMVVRSEDQLDRLLRIFGSTVFLLSLCAVAHYLGLLDAFGLIMTDRALGLTAALAGCVFVARYQQAPHLRPLLGWASCVLLAVVTGGRMATVTLLIIPALYPKHRSRLTQFKVLLIVAALACILFYTPTFQNRFFLDGNGSLTDVFRGDFLSFGRFEKWPEIWDEAWRRPYFGAGVGSAYNFVPTVWEDMTHVHNDYLRVGFELGLVGVALFLGVMVWQLWNLRLQIKRSQGVVRTAFIASWLGFLVFMISALTDNTLGYNLWYMNPLFAVLGAAYGVAGRSENWGAWITPNDRAFDPPSSKAHSNDRARRVGGAQSLGFR